MEKTKCPRRGDTIRRSLLFLSPSCDLWFFWVSSVPEPDVASSDATNMECTFYADGESYVINGKKWWSSGESLTLSLAGGKKKQREESLFFTLRTDPVLRGSGLGKRATSLLAKINWLRIIMGLNYRTKQRKYKKQLKEEVFFFRF